MNATALPAIGPEISDEEIRTTAAQVAYSAGIKGLEPVVRRLLEMERRFDRAAAQVSALENQKDELLQRIAALESEVDRLKSSAPPHRARVEKR